MSEQGTFWPGISTRPHKRGGGGPPRIDLSGKRVGMLMVIGFYRRTRSKKGWSRNLFKCQCDCGSPPVIRGVGYLCRSLRSATNISCGCANKTAIKHGLRHTPEYKAYIQAKGRCRNPRNRAYAYYGGRGVEFRYRSLREFLADVGMKPEPKHLYSLDRINDSDEKPGHYEPGNCRWATKKEQAANRRVWIKAAKYDELMRKAS